VRQHDQPALPALRGFPTAVFSDVYDKWIGGGDDVDVDGGVEWYHDGWWLWDGDGDPADKGADGGGVDDNWAGACVYECGEPAVWANTLLVK
jgi:hypothetical protein